MKKPAPKPTNIVCDACGLSWESHGEKPTLETCIELLKAQAAPRPYIPSLASTSARDITNFTGIPIGDVRMGKIQ